jgi:hypothetical protein
MSRAASARPAVSAATSGAAVPADRISGDQFVDLMIVLLAVCWVAGT